MSQKTPYNPAVNDDFDIYNVLGFTVAERKVMLTLTKMAKSVAMISRHSQVPTMTVVYCLKKLEARKLVRKIRNEKRVAWKSNLPRIVRHFKNIPPDQLL